MPVVSVVDCSPHRGFDALRLRYNHPKHGGGQMTRLADRNTNDLRGEDHRFAQRILAAIKHPDCPTFMLDLEASRLARFITLRLKRQEGPSDE